MTGGVGVGVDVGVAAGVPVCTGAGAHAAGNNTKASKTEIRTPMVLILLHYVPDYNTTAAVTGALPCTRDVACLSAWPPKNTAPQLNKMDFCSATNGKQRSKAVVAGGSIMAPETVGMTLGGPGRQSPPQQGRTWAAMLSLTTYAEYFTRNYLVWARPGEKPELIEVGKAEQLTCPKCRETLKPGATRLAKLSDDFHDVFRCPGCKHIFSPGN